MTARIGRRIGLVIALLTLSLGGARAASIEELVRETQRTSSADGNLTMVWWMPFEFWQASLGANAQVPEELRNQILSLMSKYNIIAVVRARPAPEGFTDIQSKDAIQKAITVTFEGKPVQAVPPEQLDPAMQVILAQFKPAVAGMLGQVGQAMEFLIYPGVADGKRLIDPTQPGLLKVSLFSQDIQFRLPLGSVMPLRTDPKSGETFPGNYLYNPFTGEKLPPPAP